jgi:hypothetical protein
MSTLFSFVPLVLAVLLFGLFAKLAARILRRTNLTWSHALLFGVFAFLLGAAGTLLNKFSGFTLPLPVAVLAALLLQLGFGGWYFGPRATNQAGMPVMFRGGVVLALITYLLVIVLGIMVAVVLPFFLRGANG